MSSANTGDKLSKDWGEVVVNGANGWKENAKVCIMFTYEKPVVTITTAAETTTTTTETTAAITTTDTTEQEVTETTTTETFILTTNVDENGIVDVSDAVLLAWYNSEDETAVN